MMETVPASYHLQEVTKLEAEIKQLRGISLGLCAERDNAWLEVERLRIRCRRFDEYRSEAVEKIIALEDEIERLQADLRNVPK
jgi:chromosome segregation ATPase